MDTLKLTALALLIPVGALVSETATAYPEPLSQTYGAGERGKSGYCFQDVTRLPELAARDAGLGAASDRIIESLTPSSTSFLVGFRHQPTGACRLDLNPIETKEPTSARW